MCNPTGSYKDRFAAAEMAALIERHQVGCIATSSGNTGAAMAAYAARCGLGCTIVVNELAPAAKLQQMQSLRRTGPPRKGLHHLSRRDGSGFTASSRHSPDGAGMSLVVSAYRYCPRGMAGVERISTELQHQRAHPGSRLRAGWRWRAVHRGLARLCLASDPRHRACTPCSQQGCATVVAAFLRGDDDIRPVTSTTRISGLSVPFDIDASTALSELRRGGGAGILVTDEEVLDAQALLLREEGIWAEPAGATALAGCIRAVRDGIVVRDDTHRVPGYRSRLQGRRRPSSAPRRRIPPRSPMPAA